MTVTLRTANPQDAEALVLCIDRAYARYKADFSDLPDVSSGVLEDITNNHVLVAEVDGTLVGGAILVIHGETAQLANVAVDPDQNGKGIGRHLIGQVETEACGQGCTEIQLTTHAKIPGNIALYEHLGWSVQERSGTKVRMSKPL